MILSRLTLTGFKSFADKTEFDFGAGITAVVGPNGCGKSNIVDAIKWVLGEQSAKSLRGKQMLDVIFNGSGTRRPGGLAQVDLHFDNADGRLPTDAAEVVVSRRLYRSGQSDYLLNKQPCRLKDIRELFMDTGIGVGAYSVIEQGKVDVLLQSNPAERRVIFEEAAGISKYKARKKEAERRLERVEQNLLRVQDIIDEVDKQLRSIKYQAGKARTYQSLSQRLRELRASFSLAEFHRLTTELNRLEALRHQQTDGAAAIRSRMSRGEARTALLDEQLARLEERIASADSRLVTTVGGITTYAERAAAAAQRLTELRQTLHRSFDRLGHSRQRLEEIRRRCRSELQAEQDLVEQIRRQDEHVAGLQSQLREVEARLAEQTARLEDEKAGVVEILRQTSRLHNEIQTLDVHRESLSGQQDRLSQRSRDIRARLEDLLTRRAQLEARRDEVAALLARQNEQLEQKRAEVTEIDRQRNEVAEQLAAAKESRSGLDSRRQLLSDLEGSREGLAAGTQEVLARRDADATGQTFAYVRGVVADLFETDVEHAAVIEAALGGIESHLVVADSQAFFGDAERFAQLGGRVQAVLADRLGPLFNPRDLSDQPGFVGAAADWVRCEPRDEPLIRHLLGKTAVFETLPDALRVAGLPVAAGMRLVTLPGEVVDTEGRAALGAPGQTSGLVSRRSELRALGEQLDQLTQRIHELTGRQENLRLQAGHLERVCQELRTAIYEASTVRVETTAQLDQLAEQIGQLQQEEPLIAGEIEMLAAQIDQALTSQQQTRSSLADLESRSAEQQAAIDRRQAEIGQMTAERSRLAEALADARVAAGQLAEKRAALAEALSTLRQAEQDAGAAGAAAARELDEAGARIAEAEQVVLAANARLAALYLDKQRLADEVAALRGERSTLRDETHRISEDLRAARAEIEEADSRLRDCEVQLSEVRVRRDDLAGRVGEELQIDLARQYDEYIHDPDQDLQAVQDEIAELRSRIDRLGNVNLDAIGEQEQLEQRVGFLTAQRDDLRQSVTQLTELIERLNTESRERFMATFEAVRGNFQELFRRLFGGGRADVLLDVPAEGQTADVLEAGIEIVARPPGKQTRSISLLSGGEKAMTAIALLLAIFRTRPSPFALLDEVDAALDEANNERFNTIIKDFLDTSQFIVITHSKRTMTISDVMYGVTMQEAGVSKKVSVRFEDAAGSQPAVA